MRTSTRRRSLFARRALPLVVLGVALTGASPDGCNGWDNVGIASGHMDPSSPDAMDATFEHPAVVTRDNPWLLGAFFTGASVSGDPGSYAFSARGSWYGLFGTIDLEELWTPSVKVDTQRLPVLPMQHFEGPGQVTWSSRSAELVHGNVYRASVNVNAGAKHIASPRPLYVELSDEVELVPVVLVSWKHPGNDPGFVDHTHIGKNLFDFVPMDAPRFLPGELGPADVTAPNHTAFVTPPDLWETPPDDIWSRCHIQFQVVAAYVLELPPNHVPNCSPYSATFRSYEQTQALIEAVDPGLGSSLVDDLHPIFVAYGDFGSCAGPMGYTGKVVGSLPLAEVHYGRTRVTTSHEIGHILLGPSHYTENGSPVSGNLMRVNPSDGDRNLTPAQCEQARIAARSYDQRYDAWNRATGRVSPGTIGLGSIGSMSIDVSLRPPGDTFTGAVLDDLPEHCCQDPDTGATWLTPVCGGGSVPVADSQCQTCCADAGAGDAAMTWEEDCAPSAQLADAQCDEICCSEFDPTLLVSRYACAQAGGQEVACEIPPPN